MFQVVAVEPAFVLVSKDSGVGFHRTDEPRGFVNSVRDAIGPGELLPLHRLDRVTSGLILFARTRVAARALAAQFKSHTVDRFYVAIAGGSPKKKMGTVAGDMVRGRDGQWLLSRSLERPALTRFLSAGMGDGHRLYCLRPFTGRTHQLRVALKAISAPLLGDPLYGRDDPAAMPGRAYLHAYALGFTLDGAEKRFVDPPRRGRRFKCEPFLTCFERFGDPWSLSWPPLKLPRSLRGQ